MSFSHLASLLGLYPPLSLTGSSPLVRLGEQLTRLVVVSNARACPRAPFSSSYEREITSYINKEDANKYICATATATAAALCPDSRWPALIALPELPTGYSPPQAMTK